MAKQREELSKKERNKRKSKGGFQDHPENINRNGRPPREETITDQLRAFLKTVDPESKELRVKLLAQKLWDMAFIDGYFPALKYYMDRIDGLPKILQEIDVNNPKMDAIYDAVRGGLEKVIEDEDA